MKRVILIATTLMMVVLTTLAIKVAAQDFNTREKTVLTFSNTVELPGVTLSAGTYVFKLADTDSRNVVQVYSQDEKDILGQWLFVQAERPDVTNDTVVMFKETKEGTTPAIQYWYYPGEKIGKEFVYPKDQATKIAARTGQSVKSSEGAISANSSVSSVDAQGNVTEWKRQQSATASNAEASPSTQSADNSTLRDAPAASQPTAAAGSLTGNRGATPEPSQSASSSTSNQVVGTSGASSDTKAVGTSGSADFQATDTNRSSAPSPTPTAQTARTELPRTASPVPLSGLIGLLSLIAAFGVRAVAARS